MLLLTASQPCHERCWGATAATEAKFLGECPASLQAAAALPPSVTHSSTLAAVTQGL